MGNFHLICLSEISGPGLFSSPFGMAGIERPWKLHVEDGGGAVRLGPRMTVWSRTVCQPRATREMILSDLVGLKF